MRTKPSPSASRASNTARRRASSSRPAAGSPGGGGAELGSADGPGRPCGRSPTARARAGHGPRREGAQSARSPDSAAPLAGSPRPGGEAGRPGSMLRPGQARRAAGAGGRQRRSGRGGGRGHPRGGAGGRARGARVSRAGARALLRPRPSCPRLSGPRRGGAAGAEPWRRRGRRAEGGRRAAAGPMAEQRIEDRARDAEVPSVMSHGPAPCG